MKTSFLPAVFSSVAPCIFFAHAPAFGLLFLADAAADAFVAVMNDLMHRGKRLYTIYRAGLLWWQRGR